MWCRLCLQLVKTLINRMVTVKSDLWLNCNIIKTLTTTTKNMQTDRDNSKHLKSSETPFRYFFFLCTKLHSTNFIFAYWPFIVGIVCSETDNKSTFILKQVFTPSVLDIKSYRIIACFSFHKLCFLVSCTCILAPSYGVRKGCRVTWGTKESAQNVFVREMWTCLQVSINDDFNKVLHNVRPNFQVIGWKWWSEKTRKQQFTFWEAPSEFPWLYSTTNE